MKLLHLHRAERDYKTPITPGQGAVYKKGDPISYNIDHIRSIWPHSSEHTYLQFGDTEESLDVVWETYTQVLASIRCS